MQELAKELEQVLPSNDNTFTERKQKSERLLVTCLLVVGVTFQQNNRY